MNLEFIYRAQYETLIQQRDRHAYYIGQIERQIASLEREARQKNIMLNNTVQHGQRNT